LFSITAKLYLATQQLVTAVPDSQVQCYQQAKTFLTEYVILPELLSDNLSDVLRKSLIIASVIAMILRERKIVCPEQSMRKVKQDLRKVTIVTILQMRGQPRG
jgi:hypothetical protein